MSMELAGRLRLSAALTDEGRALAGTFLEEEAPGILSKGAPEGKEPAVVSYGFDDEQILLEIHSTRYVRAHEALLRLKKALAGLLGKAQRVGVRTAVIDTYSISFRLDRAPLRPFTLPLVGSVNFDGDLCTIGFENLDEEFLSQNYIDRIIKLAQEKADAQHYEGKGEHWELLWSSPRHEPAWDKDPTEAMAERGWVKQGPTKGKWFYRPELTAVMRAMERVAVEEVLLPLGFMEVIESHIVPLETWQRTGHLEGSPNEIYYVCQPKSRDPAEWERFRDHLKVTRQVDKEMLMSLLDLPAAGISYAQCPVIYWSFQGATIAQDDLPVLVFDRAANSCRYESGGRHGIERVDEFHRIEPVYIGTPEQLVDIRRKLIERYAHVFRDILELEYRLAWVTPFYMQQAGKHGVDDETDEGGEGGKVQWPAETTREVAEGLPPKGTIDFESYMPYRGSRDEGEWLEFQNLTISGRIFTEPFNIKTQKGELWSGCSGIGLERWAAAFLAQKGLDPAGWPEGFRKYLPELPKGFKLL